MANRASHEPRGDAEDTLRFSGADLREIRLIAARDVLDDRDPHRLIRLLDAIYARGFRDGWARGRRGRGIVVAMALAFLAATGARAHQAPSGWEYGRECCSNRDCAPVPAPRVTPDGLLFHLPAGSHPAAARQPLTVLVPHHDRAIHPSGDERWHLCVHPELRIFYCAYRPPVGF